MWSRTIFLFTIFFAPLSGQYLDERQLDVLFVDQGPVVDGVLDDLAWNLAEAGSDLIQFSPGIGIPMTEKTEFKILFDKTFLYLGVWCYDQEPDGINSRRTVRDGGYAVDDYIFLIVDTFYDRRNAYAFAVNPRGSQWDALISQNGKPDKTWDGIWHAACSVNEEGWFAEIAIPLSTIEFDPSKKSWGFNLERGISRKSEIGRWSRPDPDFDTSAPAEAGIIVGIENLEQDLKFEFRPYILGKHIYLNGEDDFKFDAGFDLRYRWSPSLSSTFSINTDFAETGVDTPRVNFSRFPLLFPEKREFFLEDNAFYAFGSPWNKLIIPFHSRRVGLSNNREVVPILGAFKTAGRSGDFQIGFTGVYQDDFGEIENQPVYAARIARNIGDESKLGFIATYGDPNSNGDNWLGGFDYQYRTSEFLENKNLEINTFYLTSETDPSEKENYSDSSFGFSLKTPNEPFSLSLDAIEVGEAFDPALGYLKRSGIRQYTSSLNYRYRPTEISGFRTWGISYSNYLITNLSDKVESYGHSLYPFNIVFASDDYLYLGVDTYNDSFDFDWYTGPGLLVEAGEYDNTSFNLTVGTAASRSISGSLNVSYGDYYGGTQFYAAPNITFYPSSFLELYVYYYYSQTRLNGASFDTHITSNTALFKFSPTLNWSNTVLYDNVSDFGGWNSRLNWEFRPGSHLYIVLNQSYLVMDRSIQIQASQLATKCGLNIRF